MSFGLELVRVTLEIVLARDGVYIDLSMQENHGSI
jgi:hypothetical protein